MDDAKLIVYVVVNSDIAAAQLTIVDLRNDQHPSR